MNSEFWIVAGVVAVALTLALVAKFSGGHRNLKHRRKNYGRVTSKARRPIVMLSVNTRQA
jgi:hypothetical protein